MAGDIWTKTRDDAGRLLPGIHIGFALVTMAGFQVTLYCRFWVTPKEKINLSDRIDSLKHPQLEIFA